MKNFNAWWNNSCNLENNPDYPPKYFTEKGWKAALEYLHEELCNCQDFSDVRRVIVMEITQDD